MTRNILARAVAASLLALPVYAQSGEFLVIVEGTIENLDGAGVLSGPFAAAGQVGETVRVSVWAQTPGQPGSAEQLYNIDSSRVIIEVGAAKFDGPIPFPIFTSLTVGNDVSFPSSPRVDYLAGSVPVGSDYDVFFLAQDPVGQLFASSDLDQLGGRYFVPGDSYMTLRDSNLVDGFTVSMDTLEIRSYGPVGDVYCSPPQPNSTGQPALMTALGTEFVSANNLQMRVQGMPAVSFSLLLVGDEQSIVLNPGGSQGDLCLGSGSVGRYIDQVGLPSGGTASFEINLRSLPQPMGSTVVMAGETWNFQTWYRDRNPLPTSNFTNPVAVTFQ